MVRFISRLAEHASNTQRSTPKGIRNLSRTAVVGHREQETVREASISLTFIWSTRSVIPTTSAKSSLVTTTRLCWREGSWNRNVTEYALRERGSYKAGAGRFPR